MRLKINTTLLSILLVTLISGVLSICVAAFLSFSLLSRVIDRMVSLSVGVLLATSLLHALPEAFESGADAHDLFGVLLAGLFGFFLLEKFAILRHSHHHEQDGHDHDAGHDKQAAGAAGWMILVGDSFHNFTDGILIAAAFMADPHLGIMTGLAIIAHEIPQEVGDFIVLLNAGFSRMRAFVYNIISSLTAVLGGVLGYLMLDHSREWIPYVLVLASSGFIYIALSDLMPQMQRSATLRETIPQILLVVLGVGIVMLLNSGHTHEEGEHAGAHAHGHSHPHEVSGQTKHAHGEDNHTHTGEDDKDTHDHDHAHDHGKHAHDNAHAHPHAH